MHINCISFAEALALAKKFFKLDLPCSIGDFKKAYRQASKELHPDMGGNEKDFQEMKAAYDAVVGLYGKSMGVFQEKAIDSNSARMVEGASLIDLGQGLGPTTNGKDCPRCEHRGYTVEFGRKWSVCEHCDDRGLAPQEFPCRACNGTGKFTQKHTQRIVDCRICGGTGIFKHPHHKRLCPRCWGRKTIWGKDENSPIYRTCEKCQGKGEILIWNPVIPKGRLG